MNGAVLPEAAKVALLTGAANRDERMFVEPDRIDVDRRIPRHVAFGYGHPLLSRRGAGPARGSDRARGDVETVPTWEVDHDGCEMVHTSTVRGYAKVPIVT